MQYIETLLNEELARESSNENQIADNSFNSNNERKL